MLDFFPAEGDRSGERRSPAARALPTIAVVQQKGGVGKTTIAVNLAAGLATAGKRALLVDLDPLASASRHLGFGVCDAYSSADVLAGRACVDPPSGECEVEAAIDRLFRQDRLPSATRPRPDIPGLQVVPGSSALTALEQRLQDPSRLREALSGLAADTIDVVIIDSPPHWGPLTLSALGAARFVMTPTELKPLSLMGLSWSMRDIAAVRDRDNPGLDPLPWIVPSRVRRTRVGERCLADLRESYPGRLLPPVRENTQLAEAPGFHMPIGRYAPRSIGGADFAALTAATLERVLGEGGEGRRGAPAA